MAAVPLAEWQSLGRVQDAFDLAATLNSGQVFHWTAVTAPDTNAEIWEGCLGGTPVRLRANRKEVEFSGKCPLAEIRGFLGLDHPMKQILASFSRSDAPLARAVAYCPGLRILRQPAWECLATFITSSLKQVPHIRQISLKLRQNARKGKTPPHLLPYPNPEQVAKLGEAGLRSLGLGFRAKNLALTAQLVAEGKVDLAALEKMSTPELEAALCQLPGVGPKIAHCVLLFGFGRLEAFPIDVWVERLLHKLYFPHRSEAPPHKELKAFAQQQFGAWGGYAQQFLFHHARLTKLNSTE